MRFHSGSLSAFILICTRLQFILPAPSFSSPQSGFYHDIDGISIAPGTNHICALALKHGSEVGGRARCWGDELDDSKTDPPKDTTFVQLVSGSTFSCGITIIQTVDCWGGMAGQQIPQQVPGLFTQITASELFACGVRTDGSILCWGHSHVIRHVPPAGLPDDKATKSHTAGAFTKFVQVSCSQHHCCALDNNAHAHCFGYGKDHGEIYPPIKSNYTLGKAQKEKLSVGMSGGVVEEDEDEEDEDEEAEAEEAADADSYDDEDEEEGAGSAQEAAKNAEAVLLERLQFKQISVGEGLSCGITLVAPGDNPGAGPGTGIGAEVDANGVPYSDGDLVCWGNHKGHTGMTPHTKGPFKQVSVGPLGVCALESPTAPNLSASSRPHAMHCWGFVTNFINATEASASSWDQVAVSSLSACAVTMVSELECWGPGYHDVEKRPMDIEIA